MNSIIGNLRGTRVNVMINENTFSKDFVTQENADAFFNIVLEAMIDPSDENVKRIHAGLNENIRIATVAGFEYDPDKEETYLAGFNTPVPSDLMETVEQYVEKKFPVNSIVNFWKRLMANPDKRVRTDLFKFIREHDFSLTNKGYLVVYKTVDYKEKIEHDLAEFVSERYVHVKTVWKESPINYVVYKEFDVETVNDVKIEYEPTGEYDLEGFETYDEYVEVYGYEPDEIEEEIEVEVEYEVKHFKGFGITKQETFDKWEQSEGKVVEYVGKLHELQAKIDRIDDQNKSTYTDWHTHKMEIKLGVPVKQERPNCDGDPTIECSHGLHVGATKYVEKFRGWQRTNDRDTAPVLLCLVDPMNVVAVPEYDNTKIRVCEYYPYAKAQVIENGKFKVVEQPYFEDDYEAVSEEEINKLLTLIKEEEREVREAANKAEKDERSLDEYAKILEARMTELQ